MADREPGYYWVSLAGEEPEILEYDPSSRFPWRSMGSECDEPEDYVGVGEVLAGPLPPPVVVSEPECCAAARASFRAVGSNPGLGGWEDGRYVVRCAFCRAAK